MFGHLQADPSKSRPPPPLASGEPNPAHAKQFRGLVHLELSKCTKSLAANCWGQCTSKTRVRRAAKVSKGRTVTHHRIQRQGLVIVDAAKPHVFSTLFSEFVFLFSTIFAPLVRSLPPFHNSSHDFSLLFSSSQRLLSLSTSSQLFSDHHNLNSTLPNFLRPVELTLQTFSTAFLFGRSV